jgi:hypothetical protein
MIKIKKMICWMLAAFMLVLPVSATRIDSIENNDEYVSALMRSIPSRVMIADYYIEDGGLVAGEVSKATFIIRNMSRTSNVTSVFLSGWIDSAAPVEFIGTNQAYVEIINPSQEIAVVFEYYTRNVDMTAIGTVAAGFTIHYSDDAIAGHERSNSVSVRLPVLRGARTAIDEEDMQWPAPWVSDGERFLSANIMQAVYAAGFVFSVIWIILLVLFKFGVLKRKS